MKETKKISLATFIIILLVMAAIFLVLIYMVVSDKNNVLTQSEAKDILEHKYSVLRDLLYTSDSFFIISEEPVETEEYDYIHLIKNYDEVVNKYFSNNMKKAFEENTYFLVKFEGKHWLAEGGYGSPIYIDEKEFKDITITDNKISAVVRIKYRNEYDENFIEYKEGKFVLVKKGNDWLIDEFDCTLLNY